MRVVLDTNVFVSMLLGGRVSAFHAAWKADKFTLVVSEEIISEYLACCRGQSSISPPMLSLPFWGVCIATQSV